MGERGYKMTEFQRYAYLLMCMSGREDEAESYKKKCESEAFELHSMTEPEALKKAEELVLCDMGLSDIERECRKRGIKVTKNRDQMEKALIEAISKECTKQEDNSSTGKEKFDKWLAENDEEERCKYCCYDDECPHGIRCYGGNPVEPPCCSREPEEYLDVEAILRDLEEE